MATNSKVSRPGTVAYNQKTPVQTPPSFEAPVPFGVEQLIVSDPSLVPMEEVTTNGDIAKSITLEPLVGDARSWYRPYNAKHSIPGHFTYGDQTWERQEKKISPTFSMPRDGWVETYKVQEESKPSLLNLVIATGAGAFLTLALGPIFPIGLGIIDVLTGRQTLKGLVRTTLVGSITGSVAEALFPGIAPDSAVGSEKYAIAVSAPLSKEVMQEQTLLQILTNYDISVGMQDQMVSDWLKQVSLELPEEVMIETAASIADQISEAILQDFDSKDNDSHSTDERFG